MKKKGISLVALVVTIIVLIILTGAVVATFMEGGIIDKAKDAVMRSDSATLQEVYNVLYNKNRIDIEIGEGGNVKVMETLKEAIRQVGLEKEFRIGEYAVTHTGENMYIKDYLESLGIGVIKEEQDYFASLVINNGFSYSYGYITGIRNDKEYETIYGEVSKTTFNSILGNKADDYTIKSINGEEKEKTAIAVTGDEIYDASGKLVGTIVILGDLDGSGMCDIFDITNLVNMTEESTELQKIAADINQDGYINYIDHGILDGNFNSVRGQKQIVKNIDKVIEEIKSVNTYIDDLEKQLIEKLSEKYTIGSDKTGWYDITLTEEMTINEFLNLVKEISGDDIICEVRFLYRGEDRIESENIDYNSVIQNEDNLVFNFGYATTKNKLDILFLCN